MLAIYISVQGPSFPLDQIGELNGEPVVPVWQLYNIERFRLDGVLILK